MGFQFMEKAVDELCHAMENDPGRFSIGVHTFEDRKTGMEYWIGTGGRGCITQTWNGASTLTVFSSEQGKRLWASFDKMQETKASRHQERILRAVAAEVPGEKGEPKTSGSFGLVAFAIVVALLAIGVFSALAS